MNSSVSMRNTETPKFAKQGRFYRLVRRRMETFGLRRVMIKGKYVKSYALVAGWRGGLQTEYAKTHIGVAIRIPQTQSYSTPCLHLIPRHLDLMGTRSA